MRRINVPHTVAWRRKDLIQIHPGHSFVAMMAADQAIDVRDKLITAVNNRSLTCNNLLWAYKSAIEKLGAWMKSRCVCVSHPRGCVRTCVRPCGKGKGRMKGVRPYGLYDTFHVSSRCWV